MKLLHQTLIIALLSITLSCTSNSDITADSLENATTEAIQSLSTPIMKARQLVENNTFIDVDVAAFDKVTCETFDYTKPETAFIAQQRYPEDFEMIKAAMYRYKSNISLIDGYWVCSATKASDLNMSERTFNYFNDHNNKFNAELKSHREQGHEIDLPELTQDYLDAILDK